MEAIKGDSAKGGVLGSAFGDTYLHVEVANGVELQVQRNAVVRVGCRRHFQ